MYRVLIVDDEKLMRDTLETVICKFEGYEEIYQATNGQEAVEICKSENIDLVFMDIMMPIKDGIQASREILEISPDTSIYVLSSYDSFTLAQSALKHKIKQYMVKPMNIELIYGILKSFQKSEYTGEIVTKVDIYSYIENNDFQGLYHEIPKISEELFERFTKKNLKKNVYKLIANIYLSFLPEISLEQLKAQYPIGVGVLKSKQVLDIWLYKVFEEIFIQRSVHQYMILDSIFDYIQNNIRKNISLDGIVKQCNVSQGYLSRIFKKQLNMTVMHYIHLKKINLAKEYICLSKRNLSEIYAMVGYNEFSYFCKLFKKYEKMTVSEFKGK